jgi:hypothetical protein
MNVLASMGDPLVVCNMNLDDVLLLMRDEGSSSIINFTGYVFIDQGHWSPSLPASWVCPRRLSPCENATTKPWL